ncbi:hypothetical protein CLTEP_05150 [Clostridium tepidiprofundi DSM 19306]|uniref:Chromosome partition protein Smc n=1 Tax=Clostridium tepidiprofundi DSM 19306 TaxID=1121338 RepID=A0A151B6K2_9CLOT|nr:hypothetical protein [Clostridium tepidiprofundi]KYH35571.1 hypothetical protein CLTEP_05150 [Clostridium tepidiprofundi DSM 19306]
MEDKMFELMEKMYIELQGLKKGQEELRVGQEELRVGQEELRIDVRKLGAKVDGEITDTIQALLDGYKQNAEKIESIDSKVDQLRIDVNNISMKTNYNDNRLIELTRRFKNA